MGYADLDNYDAPTIDGTIRNGVILEVEESAVYFRIYNNGVLQDEAEQADWSEDKLDGNGPSGLTLNMVYGQIGAMDLEWLGLGTVRVGFAIDGVAIVCHKFHHANRNSEDVYMRTANLPILYMIKSVGGAGSMKQVCNTVISEGGFNPQGNIKYERTPTSYAIASGTAEAVLGVKLKQAAFDASILPLAIKLLQINNAHGEVMLCFNPTYSGTVSWNNVIGANIEVAYNNNNVISDYGIIQYQDYVPASGNQSDSSITGKIDNALKIGKDLQGNYDELWIVFLADGGDANVKASLGYRDLI